VGVVPVRADGRDIAERMPSLVAIEVTSVSIAVQARIDGSGLFAVMGGVVATDSPDR